MADYKLPIITGTALTTGDLLRWDGSNWVNYPDSNYGAGAHDLNSHSDVNAAAPADDDSLTWDTATSKWVPQAVSGGTGIGVNRVWMGC